MELEQTRASDAVSARKPCSQRLEVSTGSGVLALPLRKRTANRIHSFCALIRFPVSSTTAFRKMSNCCCLSCVCISARKPACKPRFSYVRHSIQRLQKYFRMNIRKQDRFVGISDELGKHGRSRPCLTLSILRTFRSLLECPLEKVRIPGFASLQRNSAC